MERQKQRAHEWVENKDIVWRALIPTVIKAFFLLYLFAFFGMCFAVLAAAGMSSVPQRPWMVLVGFIGVPVVVVLYVLTVRSIFRDECRVQLRMRGYDV